MIHSTSAKRGHAGRQHSDGSQARSEDPRAHLESRVRETLTTSYWDVERPSSSDCGQFSLRRNLRLPQRPRPILVCVTPRLDDGDEFLSFVDSCAEEYGNKSALLYVECESTTIGQNEHLYFEELALSTAVGNIVSFFSKADDPAIFRLRMSRLGNSFRRVRDAECEFSTEQRNHDSEPESRSRVTKRRDSTRETPDESRTIRAPQAGEILQGTLTAWKFEVDEPHKEYGWIEDLDGKKYNAYWRAFVNENDLDHIRELADHYRDDGSQWAELDIAVQFEMGPPQRRGQHPRAVEITVEEDED